MEITNTQLQVPTSNIVHTHRKKIIPTKAHVVLFLHTVRFARVEDIQEALGLSYEAAIRHVRQLREDGFILPVKDPEERDYLGGSRSGIWANTDQAQILLRKYFDIPERKIHWTRNNRALNTKYEHGRNVGRYKGRVIVPHDLMGTKIIVQLMSRCEETKRTSHPIQFLNHEEILQNVVPEELRSRLWEKEKWFHFDIWAEYRGVKIKFNVKADNLFGLYFPTEPEAINTLIFFPEWDMGSEPVERTNLLEQQGAYRKAWLYAHTHVQGVIEKKFGFKRWRPLFVTNKEAHLKTMLNCYDKVAARLESAGISRDPSNKLVYATAGQLLGSSDILLQHWQNGARQAAWPFCP